LDIVPAFKADNNLQIVNTIFLTDGEASKGLGCVKFDPNTTTEAAAEGDLESYHGYYSNSGHTVLRDMKTRKEYNRTVKPGEYYGSSILSTEDFLNCLRDRTGSNVIGFFLTNSKRAYRNIKDKMSNCTEEEIKVQIESFKKNKFAVVTEAGYTEYYLIPSDSLSVKKDNSMDSVSVGASSRQLEKAFTATATNTKTNRVLLSRFMKLIAA
jgi:hypothetical protein